MKKLTIIFLVVLMVFAGCTPMRPQQRPQLNRTNEEITNQERMDLDTQESSIFEVGEVKNCRITANTVDVKSGLANSFNTVGTLKKGDVVKVLGQIDNWYVVQMDGFKVGAIDIAKATPVVKEGEDQQVAETPQPQQPQTPQQPQKPLPQTQKPQVTPQTPQPQQNAPAPTGATNKLESMAQQMVGLVNQERTKNGLSPLTIDSEVARVAGIKSQDMVDKNYFSHNSPTYGSPFDMMKKFGISYLTAGENLAGNSTVERAHTALMNSSGHRQNILSPNFTHIGIGVRPSDNYGYVFTQMFIGKSK